jgi:hypothetical protein
LVEARVGPINDSAHGEAEKKNRDKKNKVYCWRVGALRKLLELLDK